jgi:putative membrane protein
MQNRTMQWVAAAAAAGMLALSAGITPVAAQGAAKQASAAQASNGLNDPTIVAIFDAANTWDIQSGTLAEKKATTKEIRDFGAQLVRDHTHVRQLGRDLAKKLGVTPTPPKDFAMAKDNAAAEKTLHSTTGKAFDRAFLQHEVDFHKAVIDALNTSIVPAIQNEQLKALVKEVLPAFDAHMRMAQHLLDGMSSK